MDFSTWVMWYLQKKQISDNTNLNTSYLPIFSGNWNNGSNAGTFHLNVNNSTSNANSNIGTQQMFYLFFMVLSPVPASGRGGVLTYMVPDYPATWQNIKSLSSCISSFEN